MDASSNSPAALIAAAPALQASTVTAQTAIKPSESSGDNKSFSSTINEVQDSSGQTSERTSRSERPARSTDQTSDTDSATRPENSSGDTAQAGNADTETTADGQTSPDSGNDLPQDKVVNDVTPADIDADELLTDATGRRKAVELVASATDRSTADGDAEAADDAILPTGPASSTANTLSLTKDASAPDTDSAPDTLSGTAVVVSVPVPDAARAVSPDNRSSGSVASATAPATGLESSQPLQLSLDSGQNASTTQSGGQSTDSSEQQAGLLHELTSGDSGSANSRIHAGSDSSATAIAASSSTTSSFTDALRDVSLPAGQRPLQPLGNNDAFARGLSEQISVMSNDGTQAARIKLHPEHLGPLEIRVQIKDDTAQVWFHAQHGQTRDALEQAMPRLRELFADQGMQLLQSDVSGGQGHAEQSPGTPVPVQGGFGEEAVLSPDVIGQELAQLGISDNRLVDVLA